MTQIELHNKIDFIVRDGSETASAEVVRSLFVNQDSINYFFSCADECWIDWLWEKGFLDRIKKYVEDKSQYRYTMPELGYLERVAEKVPEKVADIILAVESSPKHHNPEVIERFSRICEKLPAAQLSKVVEKIRDEQWVQIMQKFRHWGFGYKNMFHALDEAKDYKSILILAEAILVVRSKAEIDELKNDISILEPFIFTDLDHTEVFQYLVKVDEHFWEEALALTSKKLGEAVIAGSGKEYQDAAFPIPETFHLFDVDFFTLEVARKEGLSRENDLRNLAAVVKTFATKLIEKNSNSHEAIKWLYETYIGSLPNSRSMWRLKLYVLSLRPKVFKEELKKAFFRIFENPVPSYWNSIIGGTEYEHALEKSFPILSDPEQREYVSRVIEFFAEQGKEDERLLKPGSRLLSMIKDELTDDEKKQLQASGLQISSTYVPKPEIDIGDGYAHRILNQAPSEDKDKLVWEGSIDGIVQKLQSDWAPDVLRTKYKDGGDLFRPINADGVGERIQQDIVKRAKEYIDNAVLFFDRKHLHPHYTYSFLRGINDEIKNNKIEDVECVTKLIDFLYIIVESGNSNPFERNVAERNEEWWVGNWDSVHRSMTDVIKELLQTRGDDLVNIYRPKTFSIIGYLLKHDDPEPKDEELETARSKTKPAGSDEYLVSDPLTLAINSVRGQAFEALVMFVFYDGKRLDPQKGKKLAEDVMMLYEQVLEKEKAQAVMFMFGHDLAFFYFREKEWVLGLLSKIFSEEFENRLLYLAAWEGYLSGSLYLDMFFEPSFQKLYERAIELNTKDYPKREYRTDLDEGLAKHLALAFVSDERFSFEHPLYRKFWEDNNTKRHTEYISFVGRLWISGDNKDADEQLKQGGKEKIMKLWDWVLVNVQESVVFEKFEYWINNQKEIFDNKWLAEHVYKTLQKTKGAIDWEFGLLQSVGKFVNVAPKETYEILRLFLYEFGVKSRQIRVPYVLNEEIVDALQTLYNNPKFKDDTYKLVDDLIRDGGSLFWGLKGVVQGNSRIVEGSK